MKKNILVTGGAGYIGAHMVRILLEHGYRPIVFDNLSTGYREFVPKGVVFIKGDLRRELDIEKVFKMYPISAVVHFAACLVVPESTVDPLKYYDNNVRGSFNLIRVMFRHHVSKIIFSSTAAVYGDAEKMPVTEDSLTKPISPYGRTKLVVEQMLKDVARATAMRYIVLRYFNVVGCCPEWGVGIKGDSSTFLVPNIMKTAAGEKKYLTIFGKNYNTSDGTCIRDYVFVVDLCLAHLAALKALEKGMGSQTLNIGTGKGFSVRELVDVAEAVTKRKINIRIGKRRKGDAEKIVADPRKAEKILKWKCEVGIREILRTSWDWQEKLLKVRLHNVKRS